MVRVVGGYEKNIFINCPFDSLYRELFHAMVFTVVECGFTPRCALEAGNGLDNRLRKIMQIIEECRYGIHDISRTELDKKHNLPRFNMPFELGLFIGCQRFGGNNHKNKSIIVLDCESYRYQKFISDIAGQDIDAHEGKKEILVMKIRNWLLLQLSGDDAIIPGGEEIFTRYEQFQRQLPALCRKLQLQPNDMTYKDLTIVIKQWSQMKPTQKANPKKSAVKNSGTKKAIIRSSSTKVHLGKRSPKKRPA